MSLAIEFKVAKLFCNSQDFQIKFCRSLIHILKHLKPSISTKVLSINDFITKLLSKLLRDLSNMVHLKGIRKFTNKVINRYFFVNEHLKTGPSTKTLSVNNFVNKLTNTL